MAINTTFTYVYEATLALVFLYSIFVSLMGFKNFDFDLFIMLSILVDIMLYRFFKENVELCKYHNTVLSVYVLIAGMYIFYIISSLSLSYKYQLFNIIFFVFRQLLIIWFYFSEGDNKFYNSTLFSVSSIYNAIVAILYFHYIINSDRIIKLKGEFTYWFVIGNFLWGIGFLLKMGLFHFLNEYAVKTFEVVDFLFLILNIVYYLLLLKGLTCLTQRK